MTAVCSEFLIYLLGDLAIWDAASNDLWTHYMYKQPQVYVYC